MFRILFFALGLLSGCVSAPWVEGRAYIDDEGFQWRYAGPPFNKSEMKLKVVSEKELYEICQDRRHFDLACTITDAQHGVCTMYFTAITVQNDYVREHERKHCEGWRHDNEKLKLKDIKPAVMPTF